MAEIVNLRQARKAKARTEKDDSAAANRAKFGRTKAEKQAEAAKAALDVTMDCAADGARLRVKNVGNVHAQLRSVSLEASGDKAALGRWETFDYLLPEARKDWRLADVAAAAAGKSFKLTAATDQGEFTSDVKNNCK